MPNHVHWDPDFSVGHGVIDAQHQGLLTLCNLLADLCDGEDGPGGAHRFEQEFDRFKAIARQHFEAEASLLARGGCLDLEGHRFECDEFEYLGGEIATTENFDRLEVQRFLSLWCVGHIADSVKRLRATWADRNAPG